MSLLPRFWKRYFLGVEFIIAVLIAISFGLWYCRFGGVKFVNDLLSGNRATLYGTTASILGSLLGFVITATSIVLGFSTSDRLAVVRESAEYPTLWKTFSATIRALAFGTIVALASLLFDRDSAPTRWLVILLVLAVVLSLFRICRTIWVLEHIIALVTRPSPKGDA